MRYHRSFDNCSSEGLSTLSGSVPSWASSTASSRWQAASAVTGSCALSAAFNALKCGSAASSSEVPVAGPALRLATLVVAPALANW